MPTRSYEYRNQGNHRAGGRGLADIRFVGHHRVYLMWRHVPDIYKVPILSLITANSPITLA
jgi:hypothetical protein